MSTAASNNFQMTGAPPQLHPCPVCSGPMRLMTTIRRAFAHNSYVFQCKPCGFSTTVEGKPDTEPKSQ